MGNRVVSQAIPKVDYKALVTGKAVYTDDLAAKDSLVVKVLRSPHAHALIQDINLTRAELVPDIECILTYKDCPDKRFTMAGQTYPEPSPYDRLILDQRVRFVGDAVAIVAGRTKEAVNKALKLIKVKYEVLEPVLDFHKAKDNPILVHPEENWKSLCPVGADNKRNLCAHDSCEEGDIEAVLANCEYIIDQVYHTKANQQAMMETFRTYTYLDTYGRLNVLSSTQVPFHVRRIVDCKLICITLYICCLFLVCFCFTHNFNLLFYCCSICEIYANSVFGASNALFIRFFVVFSLFVPAVVILPPAGIRPSFHCSVLSPPATARIRSEMVGCLSR